MSLTPHVVVVVVAVVAAVAVIAIAVAVTVAVVAAVQPKKVFIICVSCENDKKVNPDFFYFFRLL